MHNHLCSYECKFCPTTRATLAHTLGTKRQTNLAKRAARETKDVVAHPQANKRKVVLFLILTWWPSTLYQLMFPELKYSIRASHKSLKSEAGMC
ncbi:splicing factor 3A subunit 2-like isoform X1 [Punica granatum]|uniref:Splicing factor 3A subunit 2-like isoform X1 n=1 Tax=Punica granatum TaxID=22663 RepID=A0A6P8EPE5_PUNGR|nr:splicing factor 3A subunit 2-like isoform X1 [Punica granatum]